MGHGEFGRFAARLLSVWRFVAAMAREQWINELQKAGLKASDERLAVVAQFLVNNYLASMKRLRAAGNPASWLGSDVLLADELAFLASMNGSLVSSRGSRSRSRGSSIGVSRISESRSLDCHWHRQVLSSQVRD